MTLYEFAPTRSVRVRWTLQELELDFDAVAVDLPAGSHRAPEFLKINPAGKIPVLVDGNVVLTESVAIVLYLAEQYPAKPLIPTDAAQRAQLYRWLLFAATELEQPLWRITRHTAIYPEADRLPGDVRLAGAEFAAMAGVLAAHMGDRRVVVGWDVTVADFVTAYTLDWATQFGLLEDFPGLTDYVRRMYARPRAPLRIADAFASIDRPSLSASG